jgi:hypothetical protein
MWVIKEHASGNVTVLCVCGRRQTEAKDKSVGISKYRCGACGRPSSRDPDGRFTAALQAFEKGDSLSDDDLHALLCFYGRMNEDLAALGKEFYLAKKEVWQRLCQLEDFQRWRLIHADDERKKHGKSEES